METVKLISKKVIEKNKRQKEIIRYLILLCLSNSFTALVFSFSEETPVTETFTEMSPSGFEEIFLKAESFVKTQGASLKVLSEKNHLLCQEAIFNKELSSSEEFTNLEGQKEYSIFISPSCLSQVLSTKNIKFVPLSFQGTKKDRYEIRY